MKDLFKDFEQEQEGLYLKHRESMSELESKYEPLLKEQILGKYFVIDETESGVTYIHVESMTLYSGGMDLEGPAFGQYGVSDEDDYFIGHEGKYFSFTTWDHYAKEITKGEFVEAMTEYNVLITDAFGDIVRSIS